MSRFDARSNRPVLNNRAIVIQRAFRASRRNQFVPHTTVAMAFLTSPYDSPLDLSNKEDRKLFNDACEGLEKDDRFDGKLANASKFLKLIGKELEDFLLDEILRVAVSWDEGASAPRVPTRSANIFEECNVSDVVTKRHCDLVWAITQYGSDTPLCFKAFDPMPTTTDELVKGRNAVMLKHVMAGKKTWNSLTTGFQVELINHSTEFKKGRDYDGVLLCKCLMKYVCPTAKVSASNHKDLLDAACLKDFSCDVKSFNN